MLQRYPTKGEAILNIRNQSGKSIASRTASGR
jgi:hypothetical protein